MADILKIFCMVDFTFIVAKFGKLSQIEEFALLINFMLQWHWQWS